MIPAFAASSRSQRLIIVKCFLNLEFEKPLSFGILLKRGVCPHSNQSGTHPPLRQFCPFIPLPEKVPFPEPFPLPSLLNFFLDPVFGFIVFVESIFTYVIKVVIF